MTEERSNLIADALMEDEEKAKALLQMPVEEAQAEFKKMGYDFTIEELNAFMAELTTLVSKLKEKGELDEKDLQAVSGGCARCFEVGFLLGMLVLVGVAVVW